MTEFKLSSLAVDDRGLLSGQYWGELRIFAEVARAKSFNRAAERLGISQPTIGRKVRRLQDVLGAQLLVISNHGIRLTERGEELAEAVFRLDQSLFAVASDLKAKSRDAEGIVSISISDGMAAFFAAPAVPAFTLVYPKIQLHFKTVTDFGNLRENGTDMMLTFSPTASHDFICQAVGTLQFMPIASRDYVARNGLPTRETIGDHLLLQSHLYCNGSPVWREWQALCSAGRIAHWCDNQFAYGMLVREGLGIGLLGTYICAEKSAVPLELGVYSAVPMYGVVLRDRMDLRAVQIVFDWLCSTFGEGNPWFSRRVNLGDLPDTPPSFDWITAR